MAVPKVAVIALVAIIAVPILLGYALNLDEVTVTDYELSGDPVNVTQLLNTETDYTYAHTDIFDMNTKISLSGHYKNTRSSSTVEIPVYENITTTNTSYNLMQTVYEGVSWTDYSQTLYPYQYVNEIFDYDPDNASVSIKFYCTDTVNGDEYFITENNVYSVYYQPDAPQRPIHIYRYESWNDNINSASRNVKPYTLYYSKMEITTTGDVDVYLSYYDNDKFADLGAGFYLVKTPLAQNQGYKPSISLPEQTKQYTITVNLDSITDPNYALHINLAPAIIGNTANIYPVQLQKTTVGSNVTWTLTNELDSTAPVTTLYYDPSRSDNTYQITVSAENYYDETSGNYYVNANVKASYVGGWPTVIGIANSYLDYDLDYILRDDPALVFAAALSVEDLTYDSIKLYADNAARTPTMRVDDAIILAFTQQIMSNKTYTPADFRDNPSTVISDISRFGTSLTFGGNTYTVTGGNIMLGTHQVSVRGLTLDSVPNSSGTGYDNRINGTVISTTADPSQIVFNGQWSASVSTTAQAATTYTKTEWIAGSFAWDGMDQNFLMAGLITSLGVFIALGIYGRRSGARVLPLMLVCGGAALLFFIMI